MNREFKSGLLDKQNNLKSQYNNDEFKEMLREMIDFSLHHNQSTITALFEEIKLGKSYLWLIQYVEN